jgi:hypothetical protein
MQTPWRDSLAELAAPVRGLRVLLYGLSGAGFPGGDGAIEARTVLPTVGLDLEYSHALDPELGDKLSRQYDVAIVTNTRIGELLKVPGLWTAAKRTVLHFWDLRPASVGAPLRGRVHHVFLTYNGRWLSPEGVTYDPAQWGAALGCPVGYAPQASPLRPSTPAPGGPRVLFVGDVANKTYHQGRGELCRTIGATVVNARKRDERLKIEAQLPTLYPSARYVLSTSPLAPGYTSVRTYSVLACGGLMLLQRFPGCEELFADGENAIIFDAAVDLLPRLVELDSDEAERKRIAAAGKLLHATRHTVAHRVLSICRQVVGC